MHIHKTKKLIKVSLYAAIIACAAGAATGTYAWYSYQKDVAVEQTGTTIKADKEIQVGLCYNGPKLSTLIDPDTGKYKLGEIEYEEDVTYPGSTEEFDIYWIRGNYLTDVLADFQKEIGSAQKKLKAITAGKYTAGAEEDIGNANAADDVWNGFKRTPSSKSSEWKHGGLVGDSKDEIFYLPLAFRALSNEKDEHGNPIYLPNVEVFLSEFDSEDIDAATSPGLSLANAIRCKVDYPSHDDSSDNYIFNPNAAADEDLDVGGILNLNFDPYYDFDERTQKEVPYGEWENGLTHSTLENPDLNESTALKIHECTTFLANHKPGCYQIEGIPSTCQTYKADKAICPQLTSGKNIAKTDCEFVDANGNTNYYGYVDLSIYLEGWDHNIVNSVADNRALSTDGHTFSVRLEFSIN